MQTNGTLVSLECTNKNLGDNRASQVFKVLAADNSVTSVLRRQSLASIQIQNSGLSHIPDGLALFDRLENVDLSGNDLRTIRSGAFNFKSTLKRILDLSRNRLNTIEPEAFQGKIKK